MTGAFALFCFSTLMLKFPDWMKSGFSCSMDVITSAGGFPVSALIGAVVK